MCVLVFMTKGLMGMCDNVFDIYPKFFQQSTSYYNSSDDSLKLREFTYYLMLVSDLSDTYESLDKS